MNCYVNFTYIYNHIKSKTTFNFGYAYLIATDQYRWIRYVKPSQMEGHIVLHTLSKEPPDIDFPIEGIKELYWIVKVLK